MKHQKHFDEAKPKAGSSAVKMDCALCPDELARTAYFTYVNEGCPEGRHVQHWLDAEASLIKERELTRTHAFHNQT